MSDVPEWIKSGKCQYRDGTPARVLCCDGFDKVYPVISMLPYGRTSSHTTNGRYYGLSESSPMDLVPLPTPKKLVPFEFADWADVLNKPVQWKHGNCIRVVEYVDHVGVLFAQYQTLLDNYKFLDGSPCGKYVEEK